MFLRESMDTVHQKKSKQEKKSKNVASLPVGQETTRIQTPAEFDVLCGKDKTYGKHPGNRAFRAMIERWVNRYQNVTTKQAKMKITKEIVNSMHTQYNARFLKKVEGQWEEISIQVARDKVSHALRFAASSNASNSTNNSNESDRKPKKLANPRKRHRSSSSFSSESSDSTSSSASSASAEKRDEVSLVKDLFNRQQAILSRINREAACEDSDEESESKQSSLRADEMRDEEETDAHAKPAPMTKNNAKEAEVEYNALRNEDINELLKEPLLDEWDNVMEFTR